MRKLINQSGDTIIEVMLAMTLLSAILFTSWGIINRSSQISLIARQRVVMVNQLKEQAEILKAMYASPASHAQVVNKNFGGAASIFETDIRVNPCEDSRSGNLTNSEVPAGAFYFGNDAKPVSGTKQVTEFDNARVWIQMIQKTEMPQNTSYIDFYVRGCWLTFGVQNEDNSQFVVRLNI